MARPGDREQRAHRHVKPQTAPSQKTRDGRLFRFERVTASVYAAVARPAAMLNCNAAVIVGSDHVLVVDTHSKPSAARALIEQIRAEVSDRPVRYVINSHFHWDHAHGNAAYPDAFGTGMEIVSSTATREWLVREGMPRLRQSLDLLPKQIEDLRAQLATTNTELERERLAERIADLESYQQEMSLSQVTLPTITFDQRLVIQHDSYEVHLLFLGRGHTAGDIVLYIPSERVVATGDLLLGILPYIADGYPDEWPRTLTTLEGLDFDRVVPGHGSVQEGKSGLAFFRAYLEELNDAVARGIARGANLEELQGSLTPEHLRILNSDGNGVRIERETTAVFGASGFSASPLKERVASNIAHVYTYYRGR